MKGEVTRRSAGWIDSTDFDEESNWKAFFNQVQWKFPCMRGNCRLLI